MIRTYTYILAFLFCPLYGSDPLEHSQARPRVEHVFSVDISPILGSAWYAEDSYSRISQVYNRFSDFLEQRKYAFHTFGYETKGSVSDADMAMGKYTYAGRLTEMIFIHAEYAQRSRSLHLLKRTSHAYDEERDPVHMVLSWEYIANAVKRMLSLRKDARDTSLYRTAQTKRIEEFFVRIGMIINEDMRAHFYNVFETEEEKAKGVGVLEELQEVLR